MSRLFNVFKAGLLFIITVYNSVLGRGACGNIGCFIILVLCTAVVWALFLTGSK